MSWLVSVEAAPAVRTAGAVVTVAPELLYGGRSAADGCGLLSMRKEGERERDRGDRLEDGE